MGAHFKYFDVWIMANLEGLIFIRMLPMNRLRKFFDASRVKHNSEKVQYLLYYCLNVAIRGSKNTQTGLVEFFKLFHSLLGTKIVDFWSQLWNFPSFLFPILWWLIEIWMQWVVRLIGNMCCNIRKLICIMLGTLKSQTQNKGKKLNNKQEICLKSEFWLLKLKAEGKAWILLASFHSLERLMDVPLMSGICHIRCRYWKE